MIVEYHRPDNLDEAVKLLSRPSPKTVPLGGGGWISKHSEGPIAVVDLQNLHLDSVEPSGKTLSIGAATTLHEISQNLAVPAAIRDAANLEGTFNIRQMGTLAGGLATSDGRSVLCSVLIALDARVIWAPMDQETTLLDWLPNRGKVQPGKLITRLVIPTDAEVIFDKVARSPQDLPTVITALSCWPSGRTRIVVGGFGSTPKIVTDSSKLAEWEEKAASLFADASDAWASGEYRKAAGMAMIRRLLSQISRNEVTR